MSKVKMKKWIYIDSLVNTTYFVCFIFDQI